MSHKLTIEDFKRHPIMRVTMASCNKPQLNCCVDVVNDIHYYEIQKLVVLIL